MDFGTLLHTAQKNEKFVKKEPARYYSTKFEPPKKEKRDKQLSVNIQKFLAKKEAEENEKKQEANKRKEELLALRAKDKKATRRVNVMLKRTKSANQSVMQDAVDQDNTSVTLAGPIQPDEDDYGYVSQEAAAYYNKMVEKYNKMPAENKFSLDKKKKTGSLNSTKDRVRAALEREKEEASMPHKRKRKHHDEYQPEPAPVEEDLVNKKKRTAPPPPALNFNDLLKLAEKKQFEPVVIEQKPKDEGRLLTKKQKQEMEREKEWRDRREGKLPPATNPTLNKIPKLNQDKQAGRSAGDGRIPKTSESMKRNGIENVKKPQPPPTGDKKPIRPSDIKSKPSNSLGDRKPVRDNVPSYSKPLQSNKTGAPGRPMSKPESSLKPPREIDPKRKDLGKPKEFPPRDLQPKRFPPNDLKPKQFPPNDLRPKQFPPSDLRPKQFPPKDLKPRQFPPGDVRRKGMVKKPNKRRILDDDEDEYDSEMDDFIDDGPEEEEDYSKYISEIFGYDKTKYRYADDDVDNMESSFAQQMREEAISKKIGIMEDLEDMKQEEEERRQKALRNKRK